MIDRWNLYSELLADIDIIFFLVFFDEHTIKPTFHFKRLPKIKKKSSNITYQIIVLAPRDNFH